MHYLSFCLVLNCGVRSISPSLSSTSTLFKYRRTVWLIKRAVEQGTSYIRGTDNIVFERGWRKFCYHRHFLMEPRAPRNTYFFWNGDSGGCNYSSENNLMLEQGCLDFPKTRSHFKIIDCWPVPYRGPTNMRRHRTQFSLQCDLAFRIDDDDDDNNNNNNNWSQFILQFLRLFTD